MALIDPVEQVLSSGVSRVSWLGASTGDTFTAYSPPNDQSAVMSVEMSGTFAGGTVASMQVSNTNVGFHEMDDIGGTAVSATGASFFDLTTGALYLRPAIASGAADSVDFTLIVRRAR